MIIEEPGHERLLDATADAAEVAIGAPTLLEVEMVMIGRSGSRGRSLFAQFLERNDVEVIAFDEEQRRAAADAFTSYGKGRHPAALNYGDCMTYATARVTDHPLLFIGRDFAKTDIPPVLD
jgi:ribonuclease VapC